MTLPPKTILACTDFSPGSATAVERAALLAHGFGARLTLAHVVPAFSWLALLSGGDAPDAAALHEDARTRLHEIAVALRKDAPALPVEITVTHGRAAAEIARLAQAAHLVVLGAHGAHPVQALTLGTTAQKLLRVAPCAVLVVKRPPPFDYDTVLLPTDFSVSALSAARAAAALWPGAVFHAVHAYELPYDGLMRHAGTSDAAIEYHHEQAQERLRTELGTFIAAGGFRPGHAVAHLRHGYPPQIIDEAAQALRADLVVIAAHGKSQIEALFLGSVSAHVVQAVSCDVLLWPDAAAQ